MELDELKHVWKKQKSNPDMEYSQSELLMVLNNKIISFEKDIRSRDRLELIACMVVILIFAFEFFISSSLWLKSGSAVIVLACLFIGYRLIRAKPANSKDQLSYDHSISHHLQLELKNVRTQKKLLTNITWWYVGPIATGLILFSIGLTIPPVYKLVYTAIIIAMGIGIWYLNQKAVADRLDPLITDIRESLDFLQSEEQ